MNATRLLQRASIAGLLSITAMAATADQSSSPPPPPAPYRTAVGYTYGLGISGCPGCPEVVGADSSITSGLDHGPVYATATAHAGVLSVAANSATGADYLEANAGARTDDYLYLDDPSQPDHAWVPVEVRLYFGGHASYSQAEGDNLPFAGAGFWTDSFGNASVGIGTGRYEDQYTPYASFVSGMFNRTWMPLRYGMGAYAGIDRYSHLSSVSVSGSGYISVRPINPVPASEGLRSAAADEGVRLYSASGHDYTTLIPEPSSAWLAAAGVAALLAAGGPRRAARKQPGRLRMHTERKAT